MPYNFEGQKNSKWHPNANKGPRGGRTHWLLMPKASELAVLAGYKCTGSGQPNRFHSSVEFKLDGRDHAVAEVGLIEGPVQLVEVNEACRSWKTWIVHNHIDLETYYYVY